MPWLTWVWAEIVETWRLIFHRREVELEFDLRIAKLQAEESALTARMERNMREQAVALVELALLCLGAVDDTAGTTLDVADFGKVHLLLPTTFDFVRAQRQYIKAHLAEAAWNREDYLHEWGANGDGDQDPKSHDRRREDDGQAVEVQREHA